MNQKQNQNHAAPAVVQGSKEYALTAPPALALLNVTDAADAGKSADYATRAGEIFVENTDTDRTDADTADGPILRPFDALMLDGAGDLWEIAFLSLPDDAGYPLYRRCDPAEAAEWLTARNPLLHAVFGRGQGNTRPDATDAPRSL